MKEFNSCAALASKESYAEAETLYNQLLSSGKDPAQTMLDMQESLQVKLAATYPDRAKEPKNLDKIGEIYDWLRDNKIAIDDEWSELISALPGMSMNSKDRSAVWKKWKKNHPTIRAMKLSLLSEDDMLELLFEKIDIDHFCMNIDLVLKIDAKTRFIMYYIKNAANFARYNSGY